MTAQSLHGLLFPNAPPYRRTDADLSLNDVAKARIHAGALMRAQPFTPGIQSPSLVSSYAGHIEKVLFVFPGWAVADQRYAPAYQSVIAALRTGTRFIVVHHASARAQIEPWFAAANHPVVHITFVSLPDFVSLTDWAEDAYVCVTDTTDETRYLLEPWSFLRGGDALIADAVEDATDIRASQVPLIFQGGNCLIGAKQWFLGKDYFADTLRLLTEDARPPIRLPQDLTASQVSAAVTELFRNYVDRDRQLVLLGTERPIAQRSVRGSREGDAFFIDYLGGAGTFQPIFHIDMFVTLVGENAAGDFIALVGDPALADSLLGATSPWSMPEVYDRIAGDLERSGLTVKRNPLVHQSTPDNSQPLADYARIATQSQNESLLAAVTELRNAGASDRTMVTPRDWYHITWNNCLVENSSTYGRHVYLPTFGHRNARLAPLDQWMQRLWDDELGFEVHSLADFTEFAVRQGVVHCIKKYISRSS